MLAKFTIAAVALPVGYLFIQSVLVHIDHGIIAAFIGG